MYLFLLLRNWKSVWLISAWLSIKVWQRPVLVTGRKWGGIIMSRPAATWNRLGCMLACCGTTSENSSLTGLLTVILMMSWKVIFVLVHSWLLFHRAVIFHKFFSILTSCYSNSLKSCLLFCWCSAFFICLLFIISFQFFGSVLSSLII